MPPKFKALYILGKIIPILTIILVVKSLLSSFKEENVASNLESNASLFEGGPSQ